MTTPPVTTPPVSGLTRLLVANRGEIARRVFRTARQMGLRTVAVHSTPDSGAAFVRDADLAVHLPGAAPADTYLRIDLVVEAALRTGADCVHPGYGFLSENADFARAVTDAGLVFVGPSARAIAAMGDKLSAKRLMVAAGVPTLPSAEVTGLTGEALLAAAGEVGFPVLVKASFGGGGRGMREVHVPEALQDAVEGARREAQSAFGDGTVFLERLLERPRHIEVQVFGDTHGTLTAMGERECSIQRRHQKVLEESPSPAVDAGLRARLQDAAVRAAGVVDYVGAGTVEFLLDRSGAFFFLELNTRLQVEHPVTEAVTGLDLVRLQLEVAAGLPLPPQALSPGLTGHAIEVRLYAEDPAREWLPQSGELVCFDVPHDRAFTTGPGTRLDSAMDAAGGTVGVHYDPMLAKVITWAPDRVGAARALAAALARARLHGLTTNRDLLVRLLRSPEVLSGDTDTGLLDRFDLATPLVDAPSRGLHAVAAALAGAALRRASAPVLGGLPSGWRSNPTAPQTATYDGTVVTYRFARDELWAAVDGEPLDVQVASTRVGSGGTVQLVLTVDGVRRTVDVRVDGDRSYVDSPAGSSSFTELPRFPLPGSTSAPGSLIASMPGTVTQVAVAVGDTVSQGQTLLVLEAMKMEHPVRAPADGTVTALHAAVGQQVDPGSVLAVVEALP